MTVAQLSTIEDFLSELKEESSRVADKIVRWQVSRTCKQAEVEIDWEVTCWATAIINAEDERYLLEFGESAGDDCEGDDGHHNGSDQAGYWKQRLVEACDDCGLKLRPGKIEVF